MIIIIKNERFGDLGETQISSRKYEYFFEKFLVYFFEKYGNFFEISSYRYSNY